MNHPLQKRKRTSPPCLRTICNKIFSLSMYIFIVHHLTSCCLRCLCFAENEPEISSRCSEGKKSIRYEVQQSCFFSPSLVSITTKILKDCEHLPLQLHQFALVNRSFLVLSIGCPTQCFCLLPNQSDQV